LANNVISRLPRYAAEQWKNTNLNTLKAIILKLYRTGRLFKHVKAAAPCVILANETLILK